MTEFWRDRDRASSFGQDPERYDRARPSYPAALIDDLVANRPRRVLDVGCGTGKTGRLLAARGCDVLGVEADVRMAEVARRHGLTVDLARFEEWDPAGRTFDLVVSGQAWHWIEPDAGTRRVAAALGPRGAFAVFWNRTTFDADLRARLDDVYRRHAPTLAAKAAVLGAVPARRRAEDIAEITARLGPPVERTYQWTQRYTRDGYLDLLGTHSDHRALPDDQRRRLLDAIGRLVDEAGGTIAVHYHTDRLLVRPRQAPR